MKVLRTPGWSTATSSKWHRFLILAVELDVLSPQDLYYMQEVFVENYKRANATDAKMVLAKSFPKDG